MASPSSATEVVTIDVHAAKELTNSGYRYLDVRTVEEFKKGHADVENILNIPYLFTTPEGSVCLQQGRSSRRGGVRSLAAASVLVNAGFKDVKDMGGGYEAWVETGLTVTKPKEEEK
ncbi:rhodanese-like domain-containing protein 17 isoform X3 [Vitis vinifera]|uniref:Rhodanese-like domain-containing protein 17 n=1 Tax=Vitis vinifera TaxID=29760 RepID=A0A438K6A1_VITVI|nr:rhodanese-like domain-containing protein 17 isoform X3 [Vitis vinifera]RVX16733.1 Rhodanese-like domain-containing protein 17 [Vitis vinifera]|eukprot:XP_010649018.1 PREDICTED: rhodanese-like domain-containing protein 17 isoform X1 [Vitis vinifera]